MYLWMSYYLYEGAILFLEDLAFKCVTKSSSVYFLTCGFAGITNDLAFCYFPHSKKLMPKLNNAVAEMS